MRAIISGGGTGGHIYPALAIAEKLQEQGWEILYMGGRHSTEEKLAQAAGFPFFGVQAQGLHKRSLRILIDLAQNARGRSAAKREIARFQPDLVIGTGGYAAAPVVSAAQQLHLPTLLHEQNAFPGLANRALSRKADAVCLTFAEATRYFKHPDRLYTTGLPVRSAVLAATRERAWEFFQIAPAERQRLTLLITGGSLGAANLNKAALASYQPLLEAGIRIIHLTGRKNFSTLAAMAPTHPLLVLRPYLEEMEHALALADLAVARAGASFLAEAACLGLPTILIPYPYAANDHQRFNAQAVADAGAAVLIEDSALSGKKLTGTVLSLLEDKARLAQMRKEAYNLAKMDAAETIAMVAAGLVNRSNKGVTLANGT